MANSATRFSKLGASRLQTPASRKSTNDQYRVLLARLQSLGYGGGALKTVGITSSNRHEGVTTVASNLALYAATCHGLRVALVDANFSNPNLHRLFDVKQAPGLSDLLNEDAIESDCIHDLSTRPLKSWPSEFRRYFRRETGLSRFAAWNPETLAAPQLFVLPLGSSPLRDTNNCQPHDGFLEAACAEFDLVIVDLPAVNSAASYGFSMSDLDGILVVLEAEQTSDIVAQKSLRQIKGSGANLLGVVLNKCRIHLPKWIDKQLGD